MRFSLHVKPSWRKAFAIRGAPSPLAMIRKDLMYPSIQFVIRTPVLAQTTHGPVVIAASGDAQHATHKGDGPGLLLLINTLIPHVRSLAKKAAAFFKISRSIRNRRFSDSISWIRCCSVVRFPFSGKASAARTSSSSLQRPINAPLTPTLRPAAAQLYPCSTTNATAACLNSGL